MCPEPLFSRCFELRTFLGFGVFFSHHMTILRLSWDFTLRRYCFLVGVFGEMTFISRNLLLRKSRLNSKIVVRKEDNKYLKIFFVRNPD